MGMDKVNEDLLDIIFNLPDGTPVRPALAMDHANAKATPPGALIEFNIRNMHVVEEQQAVPAAGVLLARAEIQQHVFRTVVAAAAD